MRPPSPSSKGRAVRALYSDTYPVIIVDEFQDTNNDQWRAVRALSGTSTVICLADPDQRIFDYMEGVDETRIAQMIEQLRPSFFDLSKDNHRSPSSGLLDYANAVLHNDSSQAVPDSIVTVHYQAPVTCEVKVHEAVVVLRGHLEKVLGCQGHHPSLSRWHRSVWRPRE
jgi:DNA helicase-2/ATP-dependent DNA helicase PcrA